jgi:hypothetical protein
LFYLKSASHPSFEVVFSLFDQTSDIKNEPNALVCPTQNQTTAYQSETAALSVNLTQSDFDTLRQDHIKLFALIFER